jgi:hypothetical protein
MAAASAAPAMAGPEEFGPAIFMGGDEFAGEVDSATTMNERGNRVREQPKRVHGRLERPLEGGIGQHLRVQCTEVSAKLIF